MNVDPDETIGCYGVSAPQRYGLQNMPQRSSAHSDGHPGWATAHWLPRGHNGRTCSIAAIVEDLLEAILVNVTGHCQVAQYSQPARLYQTCGDPKKEIPMESSDTAL
jgi:hypothetical protein